MNSRVIESSDGREKLAGSHVPRCVGSYGGVSKLAAQFCLRFYLPAYLQSNHLVNHVNVPISRPPELHVLDSQFNSAEYSTCETCSILLSSKSNAMSS